MSVAKERVESSLIVYVTATGGALKLGAKIHQKNGFSSDFFTCCALLLGICSPAKKGFLNFKL
jgi:hypothetical protein